MNAIDKHRVKKNALFEWIIFLPYFKYGRKIIGWGIKISKY